MARNKNAYDAIGQRGTVPKLRDKNILDFKIKAISTFVQRFLVIRIIKFYRYSITSSSNR